MKNSILKLSVLLFIAMGVFSCETEPLDDGLGEGQDPTLESLFSVNIQDESFSTNNTTASIESGKLTITALSAKDKFVLESQGVVAGTYTNSQLNFKYTNLETSEVYTSIHPISGLSNSELTVTSIDFQAETITGIFHFTGYKVSGDAENPTVQEMSFSQGVFTTISYGEGSVIDPDPEDPDPEDPEEVCNLAITAAEVALENYLTASEENFVEYCNAYRTALENKQTACGDDDGAIQAIIDSLDCVISTPITNTITVIIDTNQIVFDTITVEQTGSFYKVTGVNSDETNNFIIFYIPVGQTGNGLLVNFSLTIGSTIYTAVSGIDPNYQFTSNVEVNSIDKVAGTFSGYVIDNIGNLLNLSNSHFDVKP